MNLKQSSCGSGENPARTELRGPVIPWNARKSLSD